MCESSEKTSSSLTLSLCDIYTMHTIHKVWLHLEIIFLTKSRTGQQELTFRVAMVHPPLFETHGQSQPNPKQRIPVAEQNGDLSPQFFFSKK